MSEQILREHRAIWHEKPVLRAIYSDFYSRIVARCAVGRTLEVGGGSGNLKEFRGDVVSTDIVPMPWLDAAADAQALPFRSNSFANVVAVDVVHHVERPVRFLSEAYRVLEPDGRLVLLEPAITPVSWVFYKLFHEEPVVMGANPLADGPLDPGRKPFDANQAIPTLLFGRYREQMLATFPGLCVEHYEWLSLVAYPLSGGFRSWSLVPLEIVAGLLKLEDAVASVLGRLLAFRLFAVLRKTDRAR